MYKKKLYGLAALGAVLCLICALGAFARPENASNAAILAGVSFVFSSACMVFGAQE